MAAAAVEKIVVAAAKATTTVAETATTTQTAAAAAVAAAAFTFIDEPGGLVLHELNGVPVAGEEIFRGRLSLWRNGSSVAGDQRHGAQAEETVDH